ncbi:hypothetical protein M409DRAFT_67974 [Zasmidium cellare ATCC 36951]|uniref:NmrA-like domain-containing protein n=1 Tax=Zasmidium cellare ATCC 36951 TaxID=1080233 RepID=A0A6A6CE95_ZASCE|nr:uncharacterized protein M409DRAFT_67974 [Zasmidium cellare ATCC 36951]KAF2164488.1 hypothetical protein M409DRAFT_67974 [Zasmidium cellare ATCC 36951]
MSKPLLVIFGITGQQGSSLATHILTDPLLSKTYSLRGITRDPSKPDAQALQSRGVELVKCDLDDRASIRAALQTAHTVFAMTATMYKPGGMEQELAQGKAIADEAVAAGVQFFVYSAVPSPRKISRGKYLVDSFDIKDDVKDYIEGLPLRSAFFWPGSFMQNFHGELAPRPGPDGSLAITNFVSPTTKYPLIDIAGDTGKFVGAMLAEPDKYVGKTVCAATRTYTMTEMCEIMSRSCGKNIAYNQVPKDVFAGFVPEAIRETLLNMLAYFEEFGYYGPETEQLVGVAANGARRKPVEFEEYLKRDPLKV